MKLAALAVHAPSRRITNSDILDFIKIHSPSLSATALELLQREVAYLLKTTGSHTRFYRDQNKAEKAIDFVDNAVNDALQKAALTKTDIDLLIFCGVGRGFIEPANAYFVAQKLGINCPGFDIVDACMSWVRALELANFYLQKPEYRNVLVVNAEFTVYEYGFPEVFRLNDRSKIAYTFPAYTIGEAAAATVLQKSEAHWQFDYLAEPAAAALCTIPMAHYRDFARADDRIGLNGDYQFVSFGSQLFEQTAASMAKLVARSSINLAEADLLFPHSAADEPLIKITNKFGVPRTKVFNDSFAAYGNLISASIPAAMNLALQQGRLKRGMNCVLCPASAGMSFGLVKFTY